MVLYDSLPKLPRLLRALGQLDLAGLDVRLHFWDNTPGSGARGLVLDDPTVLAVDFLESDAGNIGFGPAHNRLAYSFGYDSDYILLLNPDTIPFDDVLVRLVSAAQQRPRAALVEAAQFPVEHQKAFDPITGHTDWCCATCLLVRSDTFQRLGGFDECLFLYCEDVDLSWRAWLAGYECVYVPEARCAHISQEDDIDKDRGPEIYHMELGNLYLRSKYFGGAAIEEHLAFLRPRFDGAFIERLVGDLARIGVRQPARRRHPRVSCAPDHVNYGPTRWQP